MGSTSRSRNSRSPQPSRFASIAWERAIVPLESVLARASMKKARVEGVPGGYVIRCETPPADV
jgi:hypothetical protein